MNRAKLKELREETEGSINFSALLKKVMPSKPRENGTPAGFAALAEAFRRNGIHAEYNPNNELQDNLNKKCLPNPSTLTNNFKVKEANNA